MCVAHDEEEQVDRQEETPRHQESQKHCYILVLGLCNCVVRLYDQMAWEREVTLLADLLNMVDCATQHLQERISSVVQLLWGCIHVNAIPVGHGDRKGYARPAEVS